MGTKVKNYTFSLPSNIVERFKEYARDKYIPSLNSGVKEALEEYSTKIEKEMLKAKMLEASKDELFMKDLEDSMKAFDSSDAEAGNGADEW